MASTSHSLVGLLKQGEAPFRLYDMGRRIAKLSPSQFEQVERGEIPYPQPYLHHAWLALFLWNPKQKQQNVVWFLKFPLDEQGFLVQAVRDDFMHRLMRNIDQMLAAESLDSVEDALKDNPFSFTPDEQKMAMFNALSRSTLGFPPSQYYSACKSYFTGEQPLDWQQLGYQGIADLVVRLDKYQEQLAAQLPQLPDEPLVALCSNLEHAEPNLALSEQIAARIATTDRASVAAALVRALSGSSAHSLREKVTRELLNGSLGRDAEVLAAIGSRGYTCLQVPELLQQFLENLAHCEAGQQGFSRLLADLMFIPVMRVLILQAFRQPGRSDKLTLAIGEMFGKTFH